MIKYDKSLSIKDLLSTHFPQHSRILDGMFTKTSYFLTPAINLSRYSHGFKNAYLNDENKDLNIPFGIYCLFAIDNLSTKVWKSTVKKLEESPTFQVSYDLGWDNKEKKHLIVYVFTIPEEYHEDYKIFIEGKYTKFSKKFKGLFTENIIVKEKMNKSIPYGIIHRQKYLLDVLHKKTGIPISELEPLEEYWGKPDEFETLKKIVYEK